MALASKNGDEPIRILLAGGKPIFRAGLRKLLGKEPGVEVVADSDGGEEALRLAGELKPDVLLVDFPANDPSECKLLRRLAKSCSGARIVLLAPAEAAGEPADFFSLGVRGVVLKESGCAALVAGIRSVMDGMRWFGDAALAPSGKKVRKIARVPEVAAPARTFGLTKRELEVVAAAVSGRSNREIAQKFSISEDTVKHHMTSIFDKTGVYNRLELVLFAIHHGLVAGP